HTRFSRDWSSDVCSSDLRLLVGPELAAPPREEGRQETRHGQGPEYEGTPVNPVIQQEEQDDHRAGSQEEQRAVPPPAPVLLGGELPEAQFLAALVQLVVPPAQEPAGLLLVLAEPTVQGREAEFGRAAGDRLQQEVQDRKSTRLNSSHV